MLVIEIRCNGCDSVGLCEEHDSKRFLRRKLADRGWRCLEAKNEDLCARCLDILAEDGEKARELRKKIGKVHVGAPQKKRGRRTGKVQARGKRRGRPPGRKPGRPPGKRRGRPPGRKPGRRVYTVRKRSRLTPDVEIPTVANIAPAQESGAEAVPPLSVPTQDSF